MRFSPTLVRTRYAVAALGLVALAACGGGHQDRAVHGLVPWVDRPAETAQLAQATTAPTCAVAALRLPRDQQRWGGVWNDAVSGYFMIENSGRRTCELPGPSRVTAATGSGGQIGFDVGGLAVPAVVLGPGDRVQVQVSSPYDCHKPLVRSAGFALEFPTGTLRIPDAHMAVQCGGALVDFSARTSDASGGGTTRTTPASRLHVSMSRVPERVSPGDVVGYAVTLTNPTSRAITFARCPTYQEGIKGQPSSVHSYELNCGAVRRIEAHSSVSFAMRLSLPPGLQPGAAVLDWRLQVPSGRVDQGQFASAGTRLE